MKRTIPEITTDENVQSSGNQMLYSVSQKRRKIDDQKIGDFIVKAIDSFHFKIVAHPIDITAESGQFFAPKFLYWMFGENERIMGYEGLQVTIYLSSKRLIPYVEMTWDSKAPSFAKSDDVIGKL